MALTKETTMADSPDEPDADTGEPVQHRIQVLHDTSPWDTFADAYHRASCHPLVILDDWRSSTLTATPFAAGEQIVWRGADLIAEPAAPGAIVGWLLCASNRGHPPRAVFLLLDTGIHYIDGDGCRKVLRSKNVEALRAFRTTYLHGDWPLAFLYRPAAEATH
jgi:hypothetical protein